MTNYEKFKEYTSELSSPDNYLDWCWKFLINSALQRRVWIGEDPHRLFPNIYVILIGKAGVGKGISIIPTIEILKHHKVKDFTLENKNSTDREKTLAQAIDKENTKDAEETMLKLKRGGEHIDAALFPYAPDSTTYEQLVIDVANSLRRINYTTIDKTTGNPKLAIYPHCSIYIGLPELGSLFKKRTENLINFLLGMYDSPDDYEHKTKTQGSDRIRRGCLSILAGTTPEYMETIFNEQLINQGFSSRCFFIFAAKNRKHVILPEPLTESQRQCRQDILNHIKELAKLYGEIKLEPASKEYLKSWWIDTEELRYKNGNGHSKLDPYFGRKNIHTIKIAIANHFSERTDLVLTLEDIKSAISDLEKEEKNMINALTFEGDNPLAKPAEKILEVIKGNPERYGMLDLLCIKDVWKSLPQGKKSLEEVMAYLIGTDQIKEEEKINEMNKIKLVYKAII